MTIFHLQGRVDEEWHLIAIFYDRRLEKPIRRACDELDAADGDPPIVEYRILAYEHAEPVVENLGSVTQG